MTETTTVQPTIPEEPGAAAAPICEARNISVSFGAPDSAKACWTT